MSAVKEIRVVILTRGNTLEHWEVQALKAVEALPFVVVMLIVEDGTPESPAKSLLSRITGYKWKRLFWNRWFKRAGNVDARKSASIAEMFRNVPRIKVIPELRGKYSQHFSEEDMDRVIDMDPDVILRFGFNILRGEILERAEHGVWSYHHADHEIIRGGPAGFWEYLLGEPHTGAILQRLTEKLDDGIVLRRGYWPVVKHSFRENLNSLLLNSSGWMANALTEIHHHGFVRPQHSEAPSNAKVYSYPGNFRMILFWIVLLGNKFAFHWDNLFRPETWMIGIVDQSIADVFQNGIQKKIQWMKAPRDDSYFADPFSFMNKDGATGILCEHFSGKEQRSCIVTPYGVHTFYDPASHVSFPGTITIEGVQYLLPESSAAGKCELVDVNNLNRKITLLDEPIVDPVLFHHNGLWWLFGHHLNEQNNSALFIYYSESPLSGFKPHALNPVKTDIRNSRPAGNIVNYNGALIRPAQDSAITYGHAIVLNEIVELTTTSYVERPLKRITANPDWEYEKGIHTINAHGESTLIDAKSFRFNFANFKAQFSRKARRISGK